jgi:hypothetical protein
VATLAYLNPVPVLAMEIDDKVKRKWCPLCNEWKAATVMVSQLRETDSVGTSREITYCPQCGAMLRDQPKEKPSTGN